MRALVTGCAGFIGHNLVKELLKQGWIVYGVDSLLTGTEENIERSGIQSEHVFKTTVQEYLSILEQLKWCVNKDGKGAEQYDVVFHLAALPRVPVSFEKPAESLTNNVASTIAALEIARKTGAVFVYSSSSSVYGSQPVMPLHEFIKPHPESPYALSKLIGEELCEQYEYAFGLYSLCLRYFNVYGQGMTSGGYATAIRTFLDQRKAGKPLTVTGDGTQERDFTHVTDVVEANIKSAHYLLERRKNLGLHPIERKFNIGSGQPQTLRHVAELISDKVEFIEARREPKKTHADNESAKTILGWEPQKNFDNSIKNLIENL